MKTLLDVIGVLMMAFAGLVIFNANVRVRTADSRRASMTARLEEMESKVRTLEKALEKEAKQQATAAQNAEKAKDPDGALLAAMETVKQRVAFLEKELAQTDAERERTLKKLRETEEALAKQQEERRRLDGERHKDLPHVMHRRDTPAPAVADEVAPIAPQRAPRPKSIQAATALGGTTSSGRASISLLMASNDSVMVGSMSAHLADAGFAVTTVSTYNELQATIRQANPSVIALDVQFGRRTGDGFNALTALKKDETLRDIPVVVICPVKDREHAMELGAAGCVPAPATPNVLLGALNAVLVAHKKRTERSRLARAAKGSAMAVASKEG